MSTLFLLAAVLPICSILLEAAQQKNNALDICAADGNCHERESRAASVVDVEKAEEQTVKNVATHLLQTKAKAMGTQKMLEGPTSSSYEVAPGAVTVSTEALMNAPENIALAEAIAGHVAEKDQQLLAGKRIAVIADSGVEEIELTFPMKYFSDRGATTQHLITRNAPSNLSLGLIASPTRDTHILTFHALVPGGYFPIGGFIEDARPEDYDALVLPGGYSPDISRTNLHVTRFVRAMVAAGKPVGAICHGPSLLISANAVRGRNVTAWYAIHDDLRNAGANIIDDAPVVDGNIITARYPPDLLVFVEAIQSQLLR